MPRLVYIASQPISVRNLLVGQLAYFHQHGYEVFAVSSPGSDLDFAAQREEVQAIPLTIPRDISPWADLVALVRLIRLFRRLRPDIVNAGTAKAGLIGMLASWLVRVPVRIYTLRGLRFETIRGLKRRTLWLTERLASACAHRVICVSESLRQLYLEHGCCCPDKIVVLASGSSNGVDPDPFLQTPQTQAAARALRAQWGIPDEAPVIGFVGRFTRDKGIVELIDAFDRLLAVRPDAWLLLVGEYETGDPIPPHYVQRIAQHPRIIHPGYMRDLPSYYGAMQLLAFPSYREGFPNVVLEAAAAGLPAVAFNATGVVDAVVDGETGALVPMGDVQSLADALLRYVSDPDLCRRHGEAARQRVCRDFRRETIWHALESEYQSLLKVHHATGK